MMSGLDPVLGLFTGWAPHHLVELVASFSVLTHFETVARGVLDAGAVVYFVSVIGLALFINRQAVEIWKAH